MKDAAIPIACRVCGVRFKRGICVGEGDAAVVLVAGRARANGGRGEAVGGGRGAGGRGGAG